MTLSHKELNAVLHDKKVRAELRKDPKGVLGDDSPFKDVEECEVITSTKEVTYVAIPHLDTLPLEGIAAGISKSAQSIKNAPKGLSTVSTIFTCFGSASSGGGQSHKG